MIQSKWSSWKNNFVAKISSFRMLVDYQFSYDIRNLFIRSPLIQPIESRNPINCQITECLLYFENNDNTGRIISDFFCKMADLLSKLKKFLRIQEFWEFLLFDQNFNFNFKMLHINGWNELRKYSNNAWMSLDVSR